MKTPLLITLSLTTACAFIGSYFMDLTADNIEQYLSVALVVFADGFFGVWAGIKREGFQTRKALSVLRTFGFWVIMLSVILSIEKGFSGTSWLSETIMAPFLVFQLISILKNASMVGIVKNELVTQILDRLDKHKGDRV
ncbi:holin [Flavobacterium phage vB_FspM_immuto_3-5A]|uniref:Holin n=1 Tax=Flavobacterium phage vB_FspM_immuto_2-6A TaxID=2801477 RepID=A0A7T8ERG3_9CAUD|nr:holin [Flavobacterium phage vB_FspM_immuto_2-6A]QQO91760.1 holin [Flavobacterium phage vB_FspM_immuto_2-6A]QQO91998.1 holin [Flavobacterium phage vB_FspM_immuto_3-5A]QQO92236.1 holin [Flavobacterium phage vB_FspM_immuto_13-6C]